MYLLSKILPLFVLPLGIVLMLLTWGLVRRSTRCVLSALLILVFFTQPLVGRFLIQATEGWAERPALTATPRVDAIVVLSEGRVRAPGPDATSEWTDADRFFGGIELYRAGKAPLMVFTRAANPEARVASTDGELLATAAQGMGIPAGALVLTGPVLNTADEAREVLIALRERGLATPRVLLVTSAFHMRRAGDLFTREGITVVPFPVDFSVSAGTRWSLLDVVPSTIALRHSETALREFYGRAYYWLLDKF